jgi:hypothetical protein
MKTITTELVYGHWPDGTQRVGLSITDEARGLDAPPTNCALSVREARELARMLNATADEVENGPEPRRLEVPS